MVRERREARARAAACGTYPRAATAAATRASVSRFTLPCAFRTRLTVAVETPACCATSFRVAVGRRSEEHTSELQSLMRISYAVFCLKKKTNDTKKNT